MWTIGDAETLFRKGINIFQSQRFKEITLSNAESAPFIIQIRMWSKYSIKCLNCKPSLYFSSKNCSSLKVIDNACNSSIG